MHKKMKLLTIVMLSVFACGQMQGMDEDPFDDAMYWDPVWDAPSNRREPERWEDGQKFQEFQPYLHNGKIAAEDTISDDRVERILRRSRGMAALHARAVKNDLEHIEITAHNAARLKDDKISADNIEIRYSLYKTHLKAFIDDVIAKQDILNRIKNMKEDDHVGDLQQGIKDLECCLIASSKWLTSLRNSGEEHYLFLNYYRNFHGYDRYGSCRNDTPKARSNFGNIIIERELLKRWQEEYTVPFGYYSPNNNANSMSMAIIRCQLYKGLEGLEYKKTIEYTGPAMCRVKKKGQWPHDVSFETLLAALELAEERTRAKEAARKEQKEREADLNTDLLWDNESKDLV